MYNLLVNCSDTFESAANSRLKISNFTLRKPSHKTIHFLHLGILNLYNLADLLLWLLLWVFSKWQ